MIVCHLNMKTSRMIPLDFSNILQNTMRQIHCHPKFKVQLFFMSKLKMNVQRNKTFGGNVH